MCRSASFSVVQSGINPDKIRRHRIERSNMQTVEKLGSLRVMAEGLPVEPVVRRVNGIVSDTLAW